LDAAEQFMYCLWPPFLGTTLWFSKNCTGAFGYNLRTDGNLAASYTASIISHPSPKKLATPPHNRIRSASDRLKKKRIRKINYGF
tara:strand:- start:1 stop:255 length:255 start_codon:yes stop_codon:yes gene_type:complete